MMHAIYQLVEGSQYQINISLLRCTADLEQQHEPKPHCHTPQTSTTNTPPLLKNALDEFFSSIMEMFYSTKEEDMAKCVQMKGDHCEIVKSFNVYFVPNDLLRWTLIIFLMFLVILVIKIFIKRSISSEVNQKNDVKVVKEIESTSLSSCSTDDEVKGKHFSNQTSTSVLECRIKLSYQLLTSSDNTPVFETDLSDIVNKTYEILLKKLEQILMNESPGTQSRPLSSPTTPQISRLPISRRQRISSSPHLSSSDLGATSKETWQPEYLEKWRAFKQFAANLGFKSPNSNCVDVSKLAQKAQKVIHYYQHVCPINSTIWTSSTLITSYAIYLMTLKLTQIKTATGFRFIEFLSSGSTVLGTKVARANWFDLVMIIQPPVKPTTVIGEATQENIPPGMFLINVETLQAAGSNNDCIKQLRVDNTNQLCLSSKAFAKAAEDLLEECLQSLYTKTQFVMDKLPFKLKRAPVPSLTIQIDTRTVVGFEEPDIKLRIIPALALPLEGWFHVPNLYATPLTKDHEYKLRSQNSNVVNPEYLWQTNVCEFDAAFANCIISKFKHANIQPCHAVCQMIVKALLTGCSKNSLLDSGTFPSLHIGTVFNFLLLESSPLQWTFDKLADRFSDVIHFLRAAYLNGSLPHFFINNPHLGSKMPLVANNKILSRKKQQNLLSELRPENLEKCLEYLQVCLLESGLVDCVHEEYSSDMWEYEFFIYN